jgi:hypothetical protein
LFEESEVDEREENECKRKKEGRVERKKEHVGRTRELLCVCLVRRGEALSKTTNSEGQFILRITII